VIFVDTSFWIGLRYRDDQRHGPAVALWNQLTDRLITTNLVLGETWTFLRARVSHAESMGFIDAIERSPRVELIPVDELAERDAWAWLRRHDERAYSFVDATSFAIMRRDHIREALAFDGDFSDAGFVELRP
jgi:predicted nucleic acid-binding protein